MNRPLALARRHAFDVVIVLGAVAAALEVALREDVDAPTSSTWFAAPAVAAVILVLLRRRRFPFAAPAGTGIVDGETST